jgi:rhamnosyltransferase
MRRLFILGSEGLPADYGGLETFTQELATRLVDRGWPVTVTCEHTRDESPGPDTYEGVDLVYIEGPGNNLRTIVSDRKALLRCAELASPGDVAYLLGYGVGPFAWGAIRKVKRRGVEFWLNPDGHEWKRPKWPWHVQRYFHFCEWFLLGQADRIFCDAAAIRDHHAAEYGVREERMEVVEYGAPLVDRVEDEALLRRRDEFLAEHGVEPGRYYTYVGRFVPDNNLEMMVRGVLDPRIGRPLLVFAAHDEDDPFYRRIASLVEASDDPDAVVLTGGVYDQPLLRALRLAAFAHFHGHEVGGTNPSLVEAMGLGSFILALDTPYNREVLDDAGLFFQKDVESFVRTVREAEALDDDRVDELRERARDRVRSHYNWERITDEYERCLRAGANG